MRGAEGVRGMTKIGQVFGMGVYQDSAVKPGTVIVLPDENIMVVPGELEAAAIRRARDTVTHKHGGVISNMDHIGFAGTTDKEIL